MGDVIEPTKVFEPRVVLPGDKITLPSDGEIVLGPGLLARHIGDEDEVGLSRPTLECCSQDFKTKLSDV